MKLTIPELSLVVLIGATSCGKSTFARKHFKPTEIVSSDYCRALVADDENDQTVTKEAFEILHFIAKKRLTAGKLTVVDATNVQPEARKPLIALAREQHVLPVAVVFNLPERILYERHETRADRNFGAHVIRQQTQMLRRSLRNLKREGFRQIHEFASPDETDAAKIVRQPLWNNRRDERGAFDIIGDVHGCFDELRALLEKLGYQIYEDAANDEADEKLLDYRPIKVVPPVGRKAIFVGDLVDRGLKSAEVLRLVMSMTASGAAFCVPGNHDIKLMRKLKGSDVKLTHGLAETLTQLEGESQAFKDRVCEFLDKLVSHYVFDDGRLVVAHAGLKEAMHGRASAEVRDFALYGETTGETDEFGLPVRYKWAADYRGRALVVYGHTPVPEPEWLNNTVNIDTGCVFGGKLTALRYPEKETVSVSALATYYESAKPFLPRVEEATELTAQQQHDEMLDIEDVTGKRFINTRLHRNVTIREENSIAALEVMSRFAANPKWLIYLPPTMSPTATTEEAGLLEHPSEAFAYYRARENVAQVVCEEKHMGSRAVVVICRDADAARRRFGIVGDDFGICYTRTGRRFFDDRELENEFLARIREALTRAGFWDEFASDWFCLDCELMPWSAKAQELVRDQYASVGAASRAALGEAVEALETAAANKIDVGALLEKYRAREAMAKDYVAAYRRYCWAVNSIDDLKLAPFHLLASEGATHIDKNHVWHMETLKRLCAQDERILLVTPYKVITLDDTESEREGIKWWTELTGRGGEGMVVKPFEFVVSGARGLAQPAIKCRGREYLRIIYGAEYTAPENLERLRARGLSAKRSLALREFALGVEALERFIKREPVRRVHECVFGVLALESEPVDPRL